LTGRIFLTGAIRPIASNTQEGVERPSFSCPDQPAKRKPGRDRATPMAQSSESEETLRR
jgi:hypothetical protein